MRLSARAESCLCGTAFYSLMVVLMVVLFSAAIGSIAVTCMIAHAVESTYHLDAGECSLTDRLPSIVENGRYSHAVLYATLLPNYARDPITDAKPIELHLPDVLKYRFFFPMDTSTIYERIQELGSKTKFVCYYSSAQDPLQGVTERREREFGIVVMGLIGLVVFGWTGGCVLWCVFSRCVSDWTREQRARQAPQAQAPRGVELVSTTASNVIASAPPEGEVGEVEPPDLEQGEQGEPSDEEQPGMN